MDAIGPWERYLVIAIGGALGSCLRHVVGATIGARYGEAFPAGTLAVNVTGSFIVAFFLTFALGRADIDPRWRLLVVVGFCGGYTTFSGLAWETAHLVEGRNWLYAAGNVLANTVAGLGAVVLGSTLGRWID